MEGSAASADRPATAAPDSARIAALESALRASPASHEAAHAFRLAARDADRADHAVQVLEELLDQDRSQSAVALQLALAQVDQLREPELDGITRAMIAGRANNHLTTILNRDPASWAARYSRGMTHLLWARAARHSGAAVNDLERLALLQETLPHEPYFVHALIGLGDAYAMNIQPAQANTTWRKGLVQFPDNAELLRRAAMDKDEIEAFITAEYSLERPFDTDLSFLWTE